MGVLVVRDCMKKQGRVKLGELWGRKGGHVIIHQHKELSLSLSCSTLCLHQQQAIRKPHVYVS